MKSFVYVFVFSAVFCFSCFLSEPSKVEKWDLFEVELEGPSKGNPYKEVKLQCLFTHGQTEKTVSGFYDGDGIYKIRFMPDRPGRWTYRTLSNSDQLDQRRGSFTCVAAGKNNHGPVRVANTYHFEYADGKPYKQVGTTCYAWIHQGDSLERQTLTTLKTSPFNKIRMCIFPKDYRFNENEPVYYPFKRDSSGANDFSRFDPVFWKHLDRRLQQLLELDIEADVILFHPYDRWGYAVMPDTVDEFYLEYAISRLSAYRHVWWSAANEFDLMHNKSMADWHRIFEILYKHDPYHHLRSIHNCIEFYDHALPWITHASIQSTDFDRAREWRCKYKKPLIYDECRYEGDVEYGWGNLTPEEMTAMFWKSLISGAYAGHGETYLHPDDILWWSKGGKLHGQSPDRIAFFKDILQHTPAEGLKPAGPYAAAKHQEQYIYYFAEEQPRKWSFDLPGHIFYTVEVIDTWNMEVDTLGSNFYSAFTIDLPGEKYIAVRITKSKLMFPIKTPDYRPRGSLFYDSLRIHLIHPYPKTLRYTLDGTMPTINSPQYTEPIEINRQTILKAVGISAGRQSDVLEVEFRKTGLYSPVETGEIEQGLQYAYYQGEWQNMPEFETLKPKRRGIVDRIALDAVTEEDDDYFGVIYSGFIRIPADNVYTFFSSSDDGSILYIDGERIIENDGIHGIVEKMGQIGLKKGYHNFTLLFFDNWYDQFLSVEIESNRMTRQEIPASLLFHNPAKN